MSDIIYPSELDYAFLAKYAEVSGGSLTAVSASYTHVQVPAVPCGHQLTVAGRVRCDPKSEVVLSISVRAPGEIYQFEADYPLDAAAYGGQPYGSPERVGLLFAVGGPIPLLAEGDYEVDVLIDSEVARKLRFNVTATDAQ